MPLEVQEWTGQKKQGRETKMIFVRKSVIRKGKEERKKETFTL